MKCSQDYTLLFVAFDLQERQPCSPRVNCSCKGIICGSDYFVQNLSRYLNSTGVRFQGALVLDGILNHDTTPNSQVLPSSAQQVFPKLYQKISTNQFRGDFLTVIGRSHDDKKLLDEMTDAFQHDGKCDLQPFHHLSSINTRALEVSC